MPEYDSRPDTYAHIATVRKYLLQAVVDLLGRAHNHDRTKLESPEREVLDEFTPKLRDSIYGSEEYKSFLDAMGEGLAHHYRFNDHHPEHFAGGIGEMNLIQMIELLADWKAATERHADANLRRSILQNAERFGYGSEIEKLLLNTAYRMGWI